MAEIITEYDKLCDRAVEIDTIKESNEMRKIIVEMKRTIKENNLLGLAAPQIGYNKRIIVVNYSGDLRAYVNPMVFVGNNKNLSLSRENCPSIPDKEYLVIRNQEVMMSYVTPLGKLCNNRFMGVAATLVQNLVNILDGVLLSDIGFEVDGAWDTFTEDEKSELIDLYLESIDLKRKSLKEEIESDPELKKIDNGISFLEALQNGSIKLQPAQIKIDNQEEVNKWLEEKEKESKESQSSNGDN